MFEEQIIETNEPSVIVRIISGIIILLIICPIIFIMGMGYGQRILKDITIEKIDKYQNIDCNTIDEKTLISINYEITKSEILSKIVKPNFCE